MLALALEVVADHLVHAALLKEYARRLGEDEVGIHLFLGLIEGVGENNDGRACRDYWYCAELILRSSFLPVDGTHHRIC